MIWQLPKDLHDLPIFQKLVNLYLSITPKKDLATSKKLPNRPHSRFANFSKVGQSIFINYPKEDLATSKKLPNRTHSRLANFPKFGQSIFINYPG